MVRTGRFLSATLLLLALAAPPAEAAQDDARLDPLFAKLKGEIPDGEARAIERQIWQIWTQHRNPEIERLMRHGLAAMSEDDSQEALQTFNAIVKHDKNFAEGWNKRATMEFAMGDFEASVADIERTLALEPRHFGALSGLGQIYLALKKKAAALKAFRAALAIDPHLDGVRQKAEELEKEVGGNPI
jgi:tetratricopeptide (TPR) repeat protein